MIAGAVARRYSKALLELATERGDVERMVVELAALAQSWDESRELRSVFHNPSFDGEVRRRVIDALAERMGVSVAVKNTLCILSDRRRMRHLPGIASAFTSLAEARTGSVKAEVITATELPEGYYFELQRTLEAVTGRRVRLVRSQDPSLIAGVVTRVGDRVIDGSVKNRLAELEDELLGLNH